MVWLFFVLQELMSHLNHHNVKVCRDGLDGARELLTAHPDLLDLHLGPLISKATELAVGIEPDLRKCALKLLDQVRPNLLYVDVHELGSI